MLHQCKVGERAIFIINYSLNQRHLQGLYPLCLALREIILASIKSAY